MNVTFHTIASIATTSALSYKSDKTGNPSATTAIIKCAAGFVIGILIHGILYFLPHEYSLRPAFDVLLALLLIALTFAFTQKQNKLLLVACFVGGIFPDLVDLGPAILKKYFGFPLLLSSKIFPWHWKEFSGSLYDESRKMESTLFHAILLLFSNLL